MAAAVLTVQLEQVVQEIAAQVAAVLLVLLSLELVVAFALGGVVGMPVVGMLRLL